LKTFQFDHTRLSLEPRNVWVAIAIDGFNPFLFRATYSCWPVFIIPLNLPLALFMKEKNILLSLVIHGNITAMSEVLIQIQFKPLICHYNTVTHSMQVDSVLGFNPVNKQLLQISFI
jgi:hypothetical protein